MTVPTITDDLIAELERASTFVNRCMVEVSPASLIALLAERAELKRDAERYRFIRAEHNEPGSDIGVSNGNLFLSVSGGDLDLDQSIDSLIAAMQEQPS